MCLFFLCDTKTRKNCVSLVTGEQSLDSSQLCLLAFVIRALGLSPRGTKASLCPERVGQPARHWEQGRPLTLWVTRFWRGDHSVSALRESWQSLNNLIFYALILKVCLNPFLLSLYSIWIDLMVQNCLKCLSYAGTRLWDFSCSDMIPLEMSFSPSRGTMNGTYSSIWEVILKKGEGQTEKKISLRWTCTSLCKRKCLLWFYSKRVFSLKVGNTQRDCWWMSRNGGDGDRPGFERKAVKRW